MSEPADLAALFAAVARELEAEPGPDRTYERITAVARQSMPGCDHAAISLVRVRGGITTVAATDEVPPMVDRLQYLLGEGPCLDAITDHAVYQSGDLATDARWPRFGPRAYAEIGVQSMLSFQLSVQDDVIGGGATLLDRATDRRCVLVDVAGEIDILSRPALAEALGAAVDSGADVVVVDLSAVRLLSAAGIHCLQDAAEPLAPRGGRLHVICPRAGVASRILRLFDSDGRLLLHDDLAAALESVNASR